MVRANKEPRYPLKAAVPVLDAWLTAKGLKLHPWCEANGVDRIALCRLMNGDRSKVSVDLALDVERATGGAVRADLWRTPADAKKKAA